MGLSNEERLQKFYFSIMFMREKLAKLALFMRKSDGHGYAPYRLGAEIVDGWVQSIDNIVGIMIANSDSNGMYWFMGDNSDNFRSIIADRFDLGKSRADAISDIERFNPSLTAFVNSIDSQKHTKLSYYEVLARFWEIYKYFAAILYPVNRYEDELFVKIYKDLIILFGNMINRRFDLITCYVSDSTESSATEEIISNENALLCRYDLVCELYSNQNKPIIDKFYKKYHSKKDRWEKQHENTVMLNECGELFRKIVQEVTDMPSWKVKSAIEKIEEKNRERLVDQNKETTKKHDMLRGPDPMSCEELKEIVMNAKTKEEYQEAKEQLERVYGTFMSNANSKFEKRRKR